MIRWEKINGKWVPIKAGPSYFCAVCRQGIPSGVKAWWCTSCQKPICLAHWKQHVSLPGHETEAQIEIDT